MKECRQIRSGRILFSPEASIWIWRAQVYCSLLRYHSGKIRNKGNFKISARRCNNAQQLLLYISEIKARLLFCKEKCNHFLRHGQRYCRKYLHNRLDFDLRIYIFLLYLCLLRSLPTYIVVFLFIFVWGRNIYLY